MEMSKQRNMRRKLATLPVAERLRILGTRRECQPAIRDRAIHSDLRARPEDLAGYCDEPQDRSSKYAIVPPTLSR